MKIETSLEKKKLLRRPPLPPSGNSWAFDPPPSPRNIQSLPWGGIWIFSGTTLWYLTLSHSGIIKNVAWFIYDMSLIVGQQVVVQCVSGSLKQNSIHFYVVKLLFLKDFWGQDQTSDSKVLIFVCYLMIVGH